MPLSFACKFTRARISSFPAENKGSYYTRGSERWPSSKYRVNEGAFLPGKEWAWLGGVMRCWDAVFPWPSLCFCAQKPRRGLTARCPPPKRSASTLAKDGVDMFVATLQVMGAETCC